MKNPREHWKCVLAPHHREMPFWGHIPYYIKTFLRREIFIFQVTYDEFVALVSWKVLYAPRKVWISKDTTYCYFLPGLRL